MRRTMTAGILGILLTVGATNVLAAETCFVAGAGTSLKAEAKALAADIMPLPVGSEVVVVENAGGWLKVQTANGQQGWVSAGRLAVVVPLPEGATASGLFAAAPQQSQIEMIRADSARSIRGYADESEGEKEPLSGAVTRDEQLLQDAAAHYRQHHDAASLRSVARHIAQGMVKTKIVALFGPPDYSPGAGQDYYGSDAEDEQGRTLALVVDYHRADGSIGTAVGWFFLDYIGE